MRSDTVFGPLSAKRSLIGVLLGSAKSIARFRLRRRHVQILGEGLNCSEIEVAVVCFTGPKSTAYDFLQKYMPYHPGTATQRQKGGLALPPGGRLI